MDAPQSGRLPRAASVLCAVATALLYAAAAPPFGLWPLAFVCLLPLLRAFEGRGPLARAALGCACGWLAALATTAHPLGSALGRFLAIPAWQGWAGASVVGLLFGGLGFAVLGLLSGSPRSGGFGAVARVGAAWVAGELFRRVFLTGLPWLLLGHLLAPVPDLIQLASTGGTALVSFWIACGNAALLAGLRPGGRRRALAVLALLAAAGLAARIAAPPLTPGSPGTVARDPERSAHPPGGLRVALVQPALPDAWRRSPAHVDESLARLAQLTRDAGPVDLVVWPENAIHVLLPANEGPVRRALARLDPAPPRLLLGAPRYEERDPARVFNSALLLDGRGRVLGIHDKVHLVPMTEYVPGALRSLAPDLLDGSARMTAGAHLRAIRSDGERIGVLICYEMLFARLARALVRDGAGLLVNLSNDGYFGGTAGARQHLAAVVLRAVELGRPVLRSTSDGITVAIDRRGNVAAELPPRRPGVLPVRVWPGRALTPYARGGDWFAWGAAAAALAAALTGIRRH